MLLREIGVTNWEMVTAREKYNHVIFPAHDMKLPLCPFAICHHMKIHQRRSLRKRKMHQVLSFIQKL